MKNSSTDNEIQARFSLPLCPGTSKTPLYYGLKPIYSLNSAHALFIYSREDLQKSVFSRLLCLKRREEKNATASEQ